MHIDLIKPGILGFWVFCFNLKALASMLFKKIFAIKLTASTQISVKMSQ